MNVQTLAAALNVAYAVVKVDGFQDEEAAVLGKEIASFNLSEEQKQTVLAAYKEMNILQAIAVISNADDAVRKEAEALTLIAVCADGELSEKEQGALMLMAQILGFEGLKYEDAREILGF